MQKNTFKDISFCSGQCEKQHIIMSTMLIFLKV